MNQKTGQIWAALEAAGMVKGPAPLMGRAASPWYVKVLLAFSGWLAAFFLLGFLGMGFAILFRNASAAFVVGGIMIGGAYAVLRLPKNEFVEHLGLAVSLAGQALIVFAVFDMSNRDEKMAMLLVAMLQALLAVVMPSYVHRVFSAFAGAVALNFAFALWGWPYVAGGIIMLMSAWCWLNEFGYPRQMEKVRAVGYGLVLALILIKGTTLFGHQTMGWRIARIHAEFRPWMGEAIAGAVTLYVVWKLLQRYNRGVSEGISIIALLGAFLLCVLSIKVPGIMVGMVIMVLGFAGGNRVLMGLGILSLLFFISSYYYLLEATLLAKSQSLLIVGLLLLSMRWLTPKIIPGQKEAVHE